MLVFAWFAFEGSNYNNCTRANPRRPLGGSGLGGLLYIATLTQLIRLQCRPALHHRNIQSHPEAQQFAPMFRVAFQLPPGDLWEAVVLVVFYTTEGFSTPLIPAACSQDLPPFLAVLSTHCCNAWSLA